ncbi:hypothetical protein (DUF4376 domain) [Campylobacter subantarcticus LMG 24377]|uniref:DUF4376 domain-containing protein n=1 Tax=Campylobacter subantarcticus TaxID=497724 RepID=A0ABW9N700_9BACT|nr:DUF4376 domain-containing protein [Campylobacter subantarcticus]AJC92499.1 hypothetical protein (DUF4376 domain) [Campylobacter subantarcticus LMG 24377]EAL3939498.1 DUF4376 domain-containing protein [Campylobacter lari]MPC00021.1 DUF4376 domain-containing protein [Campylobacter subantarcticus]
MRYFKDTNDNNQLYAYEDDVRDEQIKVGLTEISEEEFNLITNPPKSEEVLLREIKENKLNEIRAKRDEALESGLIYNEHTFQTSQKDKLNINGAVTNLMLDMQSGTNLISEIIWIDKNDEKITFTPQDFLKFASSVAYHTQEITFKANALKQKVYQAKSKQDLEAIVWEE